MEIERHEQARLFIDKFLVGEISAHEQNSLQSHLRECAACQEYKDLSARAIAGLNGFSFEVTPGLNERVQDSITSLALRLESDRFRRGAMRWNIAAALMLTVTGSFVAWESAGFLAQFLDVTQREVQLRVLIFWILPSLCISLSLLVIPRLSAGAIHKEGRTA
jgi:hypothetical protein